MNIIRLLFGGGHRAEERCETCAAKDYCPIRPEPRCSYWVDEEYLEGREDQHKAEVTEIWKERWEMEHKGQQWQEYPSGQPDSTKYDAWWKYTDPNDDNREGNWWETEDDQ